MYEQWYKISTFQTQGSGFKSWPRRVLNICVTFFSAKVVSAFHPYGVGKMSTSFCWGLTCDGLVSRPGGVNDSHPLNTTETRDKHLLQWATWLRKGFRMHVKILSGHTCTIKFIFSVTLANSGHRSVQSLVANFEP